MGEAGSAESDYPHGVRESPADDEHVETVWLPAREGPVAVASSDGEIVAWGTARVASRACSLAEPSEFARGVVEAALAGGPAISPGFPALPWVISLATAGWTIGIGLGADVVGVVGVNVDGGLYFWQDDWGVYITRRVQTTSAPPSADR